MACRGSRCSCMLAALRWSPGWPGSAAAAAAAGAAAAAAACKPRSRSAAAAAAAATEQRNPTEAAAALACPAWPPPAAAMSATTALGPAAACPPAAASPARSARRRRPNAHAVSASPCLRPGRIITLQAQGLGAAAAAHRCAPLRSAALRACIQCTVSRLTWGASGRRCILPRRALQAPERAQCSRSGLQRAAETS